MEQNGKLKEKLSKAKSREEAKEVLKNAGISLSEAELDQATGGGDLRGGWLNFEYSDDGSPVIGPNPMYGSVGIGKFQ